jgi:hypothetical protein
MTIEPQWVFGAGRFTKLLISFRLLSGVIVVLYITNAGH